MSGPAGHPIGVGSTVTLHLTLTLADGTVAESSLGGEPHTFTMGDGSMLHGLELALYGLRPGESQRLVLHPEQGFGRRDPAKVHYLPRADFAGDIALEPGLILAFTTAEGDEIAGTVLSFTDETVEVDFNHPLAGHALTFEVEIIDVVPGDIGGGD
jgi:FKBP-type peptidyl-prolyl cis-trans isomerase SlpA